MLVLAVHADNSLAVYLYLHASLEWSGHRTPTANNNKTLGGFGSQILPLAPEESEGCVYSLANGSGIGGLEDKKNVLIGPQQRFRERFQRRRLGQGSGFLLTGAFLGLGTGMRSRRKGKNKSERRWRKTRCKEADRRKTG